MKRLVQEQVVGQLAYASTQCNLIPDVALLTYATPRRRNDLLLDTLMQRGIPTMTVGDCKSPRDMIAATADGHLVGHQI